MNEEQRLILKMLEEGKISAAEAEALLNALGQAEPLEEEERSSDLWSKVEKQGEEFAERVESAAERFARTLETKVEYRLADRLSKLSKMISRFPFVSQEDTYEFRQEFQGSFKQDGDIVCKLRTGNGRISVRGCSDPGFRLTVVQRIRAKDRETALSKLHHLEIPSDEPIQELQIEIPSFPDATVSLELEVPRSLIYQLDLATHNGAIALADLYGRTVQLSTANGSITAQGLQSEQIHCTTVNGACRVDQTTTDVFVGRTGNGSFRLEGLQSEQVECETSNGSIRIEPVVRGTAHYSLTTTNGSVRVDLSRSSEAKTAFDLHTFVGRIVVPEEGLEMTHVDRQSGGWHVVGRSPDFEAGSSRLHLNVRTGSGSIRVGFGGGERD